MLLNEYKESYFQALMEMLWRHWTQIGIAGHIADNNSCYTLDPEALLIFTARFARLDQRLYDLVPEWLKQYGTLINIHRLKSLLSKSQWKDTQSLLLILDYASKNGEKKWQKLITSQNKPSETTPLFIDKETGEALFIPKDDSTAPAFGFLRPPYIPNSKISISLPFGTGSALLRLRAHYGATARAEIVMSLLSLPACSVQELARSSRFSWGVIQGVVSELICGGIVSCVPGIGSRKAYTLTEPEKIRQLISVERISYPDWANVYDILGSIWSTVSNPRLSKTSELTIHHELSRCIGGKKRSSLLNSGISELNCLTADKLDQLPAILQSI